MLFLEHKAIVDLPTNVRYSTTLTHVHTQIVELDSLRYVATASCNNDSVVGHGQFVNH